MTNGSPTPRIRDESAQTRAGADRIRELLLGDMDMPTSAVRVKRTARRVQDVAMSARAGRHRTPEETAR
jgi:hypothetical protein